MKSKSSMFIMLVVILLVVGGLVYFFVIKKGDKATMPADGSTVPAMGSSGLVSSNTGKTTGVAVATTGASGTGGQVVALLRSLSVIQLSDAIFQNPGFDTLRDISIVLPPVINQGRRNPFAPVSGDNASQTVISPAPVTILPGITTSASGTTQ